MTTPILATKLYVPPPRPNLVCRPRLLQQLNEGLHGKLTLISAPAGFGKTTLVSEWVAGSRRPVSWLSLDEGDNDLPRFLIYCVAALQTMPFAGNGSKIGEGVLGLLQSPQPPHPESILTALLNEIITLPDSFIFVLDDYHVIDTQSIDNALSFLIEHLPPQMHLVITTREDPQFPLARYRARGQLTELRAANLRFTPDETAGFLNQVMGLNLAVEEIAALETRTEGWIAGLQLASLSMQGCTDIATFIRAFAGSHRFVLDYLVEEVLQQQPQHVRTFLLQTAILERLSGPLCDAVMNAEERQGGGQEMLETLERSNLFVIPLDDERQWYRYHHLFADVLHARLREEQSSQVAPLHLRASDWYEQNGLRADAIRHALAGEDFWRAAGLIELSWRAMDQSLQFVTWLGWVKELPKELIRAMPVLSVGYAWALLDGGELEASEIHLKNAERWLASTNEPTKESTSAFAETRSPQEVASETGVAGMVVVDEEEFEHLPSTIATARAYHAQALGDFSGSVTYTQQALDLIPKDNILRRIPATGLLGIAHWSNGDLEAAYQVFADFVENMRRVGHIIFAIAGTYGAASIKIAQGRLHEAISIYEQALQLALSGTNVGASNTAAQGQPLVVGTADLYLGLSDLFHEQGDLEAAREYLHRSEELGAQVALPDWSHRFCLTQARMMEAQGDLDRAIDLLNEAARRYYRTPMPMIRPVAALKTRLWVRQGRLTQALAWVRERNLSVDDDLTYLHEFEYITFARVLIAQYKRNQDKSNETRDSIHKALGMLERLLLLARSVGSMRSVLEILVQQALAYTAQGDVSAALEALEQALTLAEPEGYVCIFVDEGEPMAKLLSEAAANGIMTDYVGKLLATFKGKAQPSTDERSAPSSSPSQPFIEPLSQRELEVLQLIAQGLSNREISERLFLALSTVKGHNRLIFGKLQVQRRTEAVARARELGLL